MPKIIRDTSRALPLIRLKDAPLPRVDPDTVAKALGAHPGSQRAPKKGPPHALLALGQNLAALLKSSGGRPALAGHDLRQKIPVTHSNWQKLQQLASSLEKTGVRASAGQVAGVLLEQALDKMARPEPPAARHKRAGKDSQARARAARPRARFSF